MNESVRSYVAELIGTFVLVFVGTAVAVLQGPGVLSEAGWGSAGLIGISFAFGGTLMVLVYTIGPVSGCHINPAVTIAMGIAGRCKWKDAPGYIVAQLVGAVLASVVLMGLLSGLESFSVDKYGLGANGNPAGMSVGALLGWEIVLTALFLFVIFSATKEGADGSVTGLAIGGFLFLAHLIGAQLGDSSLNPARSIGPAIVQGGDALGVLWVFIVGPIVGGIVGFGLYRVCSDK